MSNVDTLQALLEPVVNGLGCELWGLDYKAFGNSALLRIFIDKPEGIRLEDCSEVSRQVSALLDVEDPIKVAYTLEVSSPGIERPLLQKKHYELYQGREIKVRCKWPVDGRRKFQGNILSVGDSEVMIEEDGNAVGIPLDAVSKARLIEPFDV